MITTSNDLDVAEIHNGSIRRAVFCRRHAALSIQGQSRYAAGHDGRKDSSVAGGVKDVEI